MLDSISPTADRRLVKASEGREVGRAMFEATLPTTDTKSFRRAEGRDVGSEIPLARLDKRF